MTRRNILSISPNVEPAEKLAQLRERYGHLGGEELIQVMAKEAFIGQIAINSSFGAEAAVLLHIAARVDKALPVLFIDTCRHFPETLRYRDLVAEQFGLENIQVIGPSAETVKRLDPDGTLAYRDPDACCAFRKVDPLGNALKRFAATIGGRKRYHGGGREDLPTIEYDGTHFKINPLANWTREDVESAYEDYNIPRHPMVEDGFFSIGCMPCTERTAPDADIRSGRWAGRSKTECGIHRAPWMGENI